MTHVGTTLTAHRKFASVFHAFVLVGLVLAAGCQGLAPDERRDAGEGDGKVEGGGSGRDDGDASSPVDGGTDADAGCEGPCCGYEGSGAAPACPLSGENPDGDRGGWSGTCNAGGECLVCIQDADCDDGNPCSVDSCDAGVCRYDMQARRGAACEVAAGAGECAADGEVLRCALTQGGSCGEASDCASGHCADGVCCDQACDGTCDRCDTGTVGQCELDDGLCGNCGTCAESGSCEMNAAACTGDCSVCEQSGGRYQCAPDSGACTGECSACQGGGTAFSCADTDGLCSTCMKCSAGLCVNQSATEDRKEDCPENDCANGLCDGAGACAVEPEGDPCETGICQRCDGGGRCVATETHDDCDTCQMCEGGLCVDQTAGQDMKDECEPTEACSTFVWGWNPTDERMCTRYGKPTPINGQCDGMGACGTWETGCMSRSVFGPSCGSLECRRVYGSTLGQACRPGQRYEDNDETQEICYTTGQRGCPDGQACDTTGTCVAE